MPRNRIFPRSLYCLLAVAEHCSFTRAAEALHIAQPSLSQQIKQLEDSLGIQLLDRSGRSARLTSAGEVYLHHARRALKELDAGNRAVQELQGLSRGHLRLAMTPITDYLAIPLLVQYRDCYPGITVDAREIPQSDMKDALVGDHVDIGIAFDGSLVAERSSEVINTRTLCTEALRLVFGENHPLARQQGPLDKNALKELPLVLFSASYALRSLINRYCLENAIAPRVAVEATSLSVIIEMIRLGQLATVLPEAVARGQHGLCSIELSPQLPHHTINLVSRREVNKSPAGAAFESLAMEWAAKRCSATRAKVPKLVA